MNRVKKIDIINQLAGLPEASAKLGFDELRLITMDAEDILNSGNREIKVIPAWLALQETT